MSTFSRRSCDTQESEARVLVNRVSSKSRTDRSASLTAVRQSAVGALVLALVLGSAGPVRAQSRAVDIERSRVTVRVFKSGLFRAFADDHVIRAPLSQGQVDDSAAASVRFSIETRQLRVLDPELSENDRGQVQERMLGPEVLDAARFGRIEFHSTAVDVLGPDAWLVRGELELHGEIRQTAVRVAREAGHYKGSAKLRQSEFGIKPISVAGGTVKVKDEITTRTSA